ncbi:hypothetical protein JCM3770_000556, partial [Rhodotorula araucariae]
DDVSEAIDAVFAAWEVRAEEEAPKTINLKRREAYSKELFGVRRQSEKATYGMLEAVGCEKVRKNQDRIVRDFLDFATAIKRHEIPIRDLVDDDVVKPPSQQLCR